VDYHKLSNVNLKNVNLSAKPISGYTERYSSYLGARHNLIEPKDAHVYRMING